MNPIFLKPIYKNVIWGGNNISRIFNRDIDGEDIGESWEVSAHQNGISLINEESISEKNLLELFNNNVLREDIFGTKCVGLKKFPILVKFIDASKNLSVQVHPDDEYARINESDSGKNEVWYILDCKEDSKIIYGFKENVTAENLKKSVEENIKECVKYVKVNKGDFISIPAGTIHAIMNGIILCEVQQSSDITYRVYDWDRIDKNGKPRELHKNKAIDVINLDNKEEIKNYLNIEKNTNIYKSDKFNIDLINVNMELDEKSDKESFYAYICLDGSGSIEKEEYYKDIKKGDAFIIPAILGEYTLKGNMKLMKIWV